MGIKVKLHKHHVSHISSNNLKVLSWLLNSTGTEWELELTYYFCSSVQVEGFKMNLIYYDLYQSTRLEKFVTGMPNSNCGKLYEFFISYVLIYVSAAKL